jgi:peptidoglycan hydrolase-like protein with peptidoglycan-binding domain
MGMGGTDVTALQGLLNEHIDSGLTPDGLFGPKTDEAARSFQQLRGLSADGAVGSKTWAALQAVPKPDGGAPAGAPTA